VSLFDFVNVGSSLSLRSFARLGSSLSIVGYSRCASISLVGSYHIGSSIALEAMQVSVALLRYWVCCAWARLCRYWTGLA
jgi:hypothetical protein